MGDMGDIFNAFKEHKREQKRIYRANVTPVEIARLDRIEGVTFEVKNRGEHYVLKVPTEGGPRRVDFWPSTGLWRRTQGKARGYGIDKLVRYFKLTERRSA